MNLITNRQAPGPYDWRDFNRVGNATREIHDRLVAAGYSVPDVSPKVDWTPADLWEPAAMKKYLEEVRAVSNVIRPATVPIPSTMRYLTFGGANAIEQALADVDTDLHNMEAATMYSGEFFAGEV